MTPRARRAFFTLVVFFAVCAVVGTVLQRNVGAQSSRNESQLRDNIKTFANVYSVVEQNYAEPLTGNKADDRNLRRRHSGNAAHAGPALQLL